MEFMRASVITANMGLVTERDIGTQSGIYRNDSTAMNTRPKLQKPVVTSNRNQNDLNKLSEKARQAKP